MLLLVSSDWIRKVERQIAQILEELRVAEQRALDLAVACGLLRQIRLLEQIQMELEKTLKNA